MSKNPKLWREELILTKKTFISLNDLRNFDKIRGNTWIMIILSVTKNRPSSSLKNTFLQKPKGVGGGGVQIDTSENPYVENAYRNGSI